MQFHQNERVFCQFTLLNLLYLEAQPGTNASKGKGPWAGPFLQAAWCLEAGFAAAELHSLEAAKPQRERTVTRLEMENLPFGKSFKWKIFHFPIVVLHLPFSHCLLQSLCMVGPVIFMYLNNVFLSLNAPSETSKCCVLSMQGCDSWVSDFWLLVCVCNDLCFTSTNLKWHWIVFQVKSIIFLSLLLCWSLTDLTSPCSPMFLSDVNKFCFLFLYKPKQKIASTPWSLTLEILAFAAARWKLTLPSTLAWNTDLQNFSLENMVDIFKSCFLFNVESHVWEKFARSGPRSSFSQTA